VSRATPCPFWATMALIRAVVSTPVLMPLMVGSEVEEVVNDMPHLVSCKG
jgi:hypothetical protein